MDNVNIVVNNDLYIAVHSTAVPMVFLFAFYALWIGYKDRVKRSKMKEGQNLEYFLAAKNTQPIGIIAYSIMSTQLGCWALVTPPSFAASYGYLGLLSYSIWTGVALLFPAFIGPIIIKYNKDSISLCDYSSKRYDKAGQFYIALISIFNMTAGMLGEVTTLGQLFEYVVGGNRIFIIVTVCLITAVYTSFGGLNVSCKSSSGCFCDLS